MLVIKEEAAEEIRQAQLWYEVQRPGLGVGFRNSLQECLRFIGANKPGYAIRRNPYRPARVGKFPYIVWYAMEGEDIVVYRVRHGKQRPLKKYAGR